MKKSSAIKNTFKNWMWWQECSATESSLEGELPDGLILRKRSAIENFGSMDVLCTDKTGTLTEDAFNLMEADSQGSASRDVLRSACLNATRQTGMTNPLDEAITSAGQKEEMNISVEQKVDEIPYDFTLKRQRRIRSFHHKVLAEFVRIHID